MSEGMMNTRDRLVYMANQIATNLKFEGDQAAAAVADHMLQFWDPRMKDQIISRAAEADHGLTPLANEAVTLLARARLAEERGALPVESASEPSGGSDAG